MTKELLGDNLPPVRAVGVSVSNLKRADQISGSILADDREKERVLRAEDTINDKYGEFTVFPAALTGVKNRIQNIPDGRNRRFGL